MCAMKLLAGTFTTKGQLVVPAELRRKHGIEAGTKVRFLEDQFGRIVLQPITEKYVDRVMGCLAGGPDLQEKWETEHREEGEQKK
jgi:AbrB family looped-hinge helix DNA binding protein